MTAPHQGHTPRPLTLVLWVMLRLAPLPILYLGNQPLLCGIAAFFAKLAVLIIGDPYALPAWMAQEVVEPRHPPGLAETTPGPRKRSVPWVLPICAALGWAIGSL